MNRFLSLISQSTIVFAVVLLISTPAFANPVVITNFDTVISQTVAFFTFVAIESIVFKNVMDAPWDFSIQLIIWVNLVTVLIGFAYSTFALAPEIPEVGYMYDLALGKVSWSVFYGRVEYKILPSLKQHLFFFTISASVEFIIALGRNLRDQLFSNKRLLLAMVLCNLASYSALYLFVALPCILLLSYIY